MSQLYLVPDIRDIGHSIQLAREYDCAFEYNDFYDPAVLDDPEKQEEIIACYKNTAVIFPWIPCMAPFWM